MKKITIKIILIMILLSLLVPVTVQAGYQSNKNTTSKVNVTANGFFEQIRLMEREDGTLGVKSNINNETFVDDSKNGIDCHMAKNTEWGTAAMLGASSYGSSPRGSSDVSITGNNTGVFQMTYKNSEEIAGIWDIDSTNSYYQCINKIRNADTRYYNLYKAGEDGTQEVSKPGDATLETQKWLGASRAAFVSSDLPIFYRGTRGLFEFCGYYGGTLSDITSRTVVVCGTGL